LIREDGGGAGKAGIGSKRRRIRASEYSFLVGYNSIPVRMK